MDKLYSTIYHIVIDKTKIPPSDQIPWTEEEFEITDPRAIFEKVKQFVPLTSEDRVSLLRGKIISLVTEEMQENTLSDGRKLYFFALKAWTPEELDKKGGTIYTNRFTPFPEQAKVLMDFFVWLSIEGIKETDSEVLIDIRFFFITRSKLSIESSVESILDKCYHMGVVHQEANIEEKKLDDFQEKLNRIVIYGNSLPNSEFDTWKLVKTELATKMVVSLRSDVKSWVIQFVKNMRQNRHSIGKTMDIEEVELVVEAGKGEQKIEVDLDDEDFLRDFVIRVRADTILADNCISFTDFKETCKSFYQWLPQSSLPVVWSE